MANMHIKKQMPNLCVAFEKFLDQHKLTLFIDCSDGFVRAQIKDTHGAFAIYSKFTADTRTDHYYVGWGGNERDAIIALIYHVNRETLYFLPTNGAIPYKLEMPNLEIQDV